MARKLTYSLEIKASAGTTKVRMKASSGKNPPVLSSWREFLGQETIRELEDECWLRLGGR